MKQINNAEARLFAEGMIAKNYGKAKEIECNNRAKVSGDMKVCELLKERSGLVPKMAMARFRGGDLAELLAREKAIEGELAVALSGYGLTIADMEFTPFCKVCGDTGKVAGGDCECFKGYVFDYISRGLAMGGETLGFEKSIEVAKSHAGLLKFYEYAVKFVDVFPHVTKTAFLLQGQVGCGKTHLAKEILAGIIAKGYAGLSVSAFAMEELFVRHMQNATAFNPDKKVADEYAMLMNVDVLLCDDLGVEIIHMEKIKAYYVSLLEHRKASGKLTIFTTNLSEDKLNERYGERFFSRLRENTVVMKLETGVDLRG